MQENPENILFRPQEFPIDLDIGQNIGDFAEGSIALNDRVFVLQMIQHSIIRFPAFEAAPLGPGAALVVWPQDGLYRIDWGIHNQIRFFKGSIPVAAMLGNTTAGVWVPLPAPIALPGNETLSVRVTNLRARAIPAQWTLYGFTVQIIFKGLERVDRTASQLVTPTR